MHKYRTEVRRRRERGERLPDLATEPINYCNGSPYFNTEPIGYIRTKETGREVLEKFHLSRISYYACQLTYEVIRYMEFLQDFFVRLFIPCIG